jgi:hypothetical protein
MNEILFSVRFYRGKVVGLLSLGEDDMLGDLHNIIQETLHWDSDHLYEFIIDGTPRDKRAIYSCKADPGYAHESIFRGFAEQTKIGSLNLVQGQQFFYHFDYGDNWFFEIHVSEIREVQGIPPPKVLKRNGRMPKQY